MVSKLGTYPLSSEKRIFDNVQPTGDCVRKTYGGMISSSLLRTVHLIASS